MTRKKVSRQKLFLAFYTEYIHLSGMTTRTAKRGAFSKEESKPVLIYFPKALLPIIDEAVRLTDTDRSKFIRASVRDHLRRLKIAV